jgi:hypothetical protein
MLHTASSLRRLSGMCDSSLLGTATKLEAGSAALSPSEKRLGRDVASTISDPNLNVAAVGIA